MDWQQAISLLIVATAAGFLLWNKVRRRKFDWQRDTPCGCSAIHQPGNSGSIVFHARKGERPEIRVRMR
jgi:hypothetical protein